METHAKLEKRVGRGPEAFGIFKDHETDWVFNRTLQHMTEKGAESGECLYAARRINEKDGESWVREWAALADKVKEMGETALLAGHAISARECFLRASNYYRTAEYGCVPTHPRFHELWEKSVNSFQRACPLFNPPVQIIKIPFEGKELPGYFWRPDNSSKNHPTLFSVGGGDSSGEEIFLIGGGFAAVRRGYNFFTFEFPGHRGTVHLYPDCVRRPDYEVPFKTAFDYLEKLPGVDDRIALTGASFGGYVVSRVAIHEKRVKALIPNSPLINVYELGQEAFKMLVATKIPRWLLKRLAMWRLNRLPLKKSLTEYASWSMGYNFSKIWVKEELEKMIQNNKRYIIEDSIHGITCPTLVLVSEDEGELFLEQAGKFYEGISSTEKKMHVFTLEKDGSLDHCQLDNRTRGNQVMFDWLDDLFGYRGTVL
ncbi:MAG: alpha/beta hydrolase family protein [Candidatus Odinarchaeota archaeon]